jgi:hypothetical protein
LTYRVEYLRTVVSDDIPAIETKLTTHPFELGKPSSHSTAATSERLG